MAFGAETANLVVALKLDDRGFTSGLARARGSLSGLDRGFSQMSRGVGQVGRGLNTLGTRAALVAATGLTAVVTTAVSFEDAFAGVRKTVQASDAELDALQETFREMARTIPVSFEELSSLGATAGALGVATKDIAEFTRVTALLGQTTDVSSDQAATALGQLSNVLGLTSADYERFASTLVDLGNKGASTESQILEIAARAGAGAKLIGLASDQTLAWSSAVASLGIEVEAGGSSLQNFFLKSLQKIQSNDTLEVFAKTAGTSAKEFKRAMNEDANGALQSFIEGLGELDKSAQLSVLSDLGFKDIRITRTLLGLANSGDNLANSLKNANAEWDRNVALTREAEKRNATTAKQFDLLKNNLRDVAFTIGSELLPVANELVHDVIGELNKPETQKGIKEFGQNLANGARDLVKAFKAGEFDPLINSLKDAAGVAKAAFDAFNALPGPVKQFAIAALVANKVSGGAIGDITGGLANIFSGGLKVLLGNQFGRGASPLNPLFTKEVGFAAGGGGPGLVPPGGGGTGIWKIAGGVFGLAAAAIIAAEVGSEMGKQTKAAKDAFNESGGGFLGLEGFFRDLLGKTPGAATPVGQFNVANAGGTRVQPVSIVRAGSGAFNAINATVRTLGHTIDRSLEKGDIHAARIASEQRDSMLALRGLVSHQTNSIIPKIGETNRALSVANRNLLDGNARQRDMAARIAEARDRIGSGFAESNSQLRGINAKDFSPEFTANITTNVTATLSTYSALQSSTRIYQIHAGTPNSGFQPGLI